MIRKDGHPLPKYGVTLTLRGKENPNIWRVHSVGNHGWDLEADLRNADEGWGEESELTGGKRTIRGDVIERRGSSEAWYGGSHEVWFTERNLSLLEAK
jgi:hypothetical protein